MDGWKLVPVAPTSEMLRAGELAHWDKARDMASPTPTEFPWECGGPMGYAWNAMLAVAPQPSLPPEAREAMRRLMGHAASLLWLRTEGDPVTADKSLDLDEQLCVLALAIRNDVDALRAVLGEVTK